MLYDRITDSIYPEPPEDKPICHCDKCGYGLSEGHEFIIFNGERICEFCLDDFSTSDWIELIGEFKRTVTRDMYISD